MHKKLLVIAVHIIPYHILMALHTLMYVMRYDFPTETYLVDLTPLHSGHLASRMSLSWESLRKLRGALGIVQASWPAKIASVRAATRGSILTGAMQTVQSHTSHKKKDLRAAYSSSHKIISR